MIICVYLLSEIVLPIIIFGAGYSSFNGRTQDSSA